MPCLHIFMMMINIWEAGIFYGKMDGRTGCSRFPDPLWDGNIHGAEYVRQQEKEAAGKYRILLDREENGGYLSLEEYLPSVLAAQISPDSEMEALKAQAVIARTYIRRQMGEEKEISELSLDLDRKPREELKKIWGKTEFPEKYSRLEEAVIQTNGIVMTYDGEMIAPLFCAVTAGSTRDGDEGYPYLKSVSCPDDEKAADFISFVSLSAKQAAAALNEIPGMYRRSRLMNVPLLERKQPVHLDFPPPAFLQNPRKTGSALQ